MAALPVRQSVELSAPTDLRRCFHLHRFGPHDPSFQLEPGRLRQAVHTPEGPAAVELLGQGQRFEMRAIGPGARWFEGRGPALLGADDAPERFVPVCEAGRRLVRASPQLRLVRSASPVELLIGLVLQQRVTWTEAARTYRTLVTRYGQPGPAGLTLPPTPRVWTEIPLSEWASLDVDRKRADTVRRVARLGGHLFPMLDASPEEVARKLATVTGLGPWTIQNFLGFGLAAPDAVPTGDYDLPHRVSMVFRGVPRSDDARMLQDLAPYAGQRWRILRLLHESGLSLARFAPKRPSRRTYGRPRRG